MFVFTSRVLPCPQGADVRFASGPVAGVFAAISASAGESAVWVVCGGDLAGQFYDAGLLDEIVLTVAPVALAGWAPPLPLRKFPERSTADCWAMADRPRPARWSGARWRGGSLLVASTTKIGFWAPANLPRNSPRHRAPHSWGRGTTTTWLKRPASLSVSSAPDRDAGCPHTHDESTAYTGAKDWGRSMPAGDEDRHMRFALPTEDAIPGRRRDGRTAAAMCVHIGAAASPSLSTVRDRGWPEPARDPDAHPEQQSRGDHWVSRLESPACIASV
jgi:hypothetical protein